MMSDQSRKNYEQVTAEKTPATPAATPEAEQRTTGLKTANSDYKAKLMAEYQAKENAKRGVK
jgi:hypothetical protein